MIEGMNLTMTYCKSFCKCHNVPPRTKIIKKKLKKKNIRYKLENNNVYCFFKVSKVI
jgi:hypothetical protein